MIRKALTVIALAAVTTLITALPAFAHVTVDPASAPKGGEITLGFRVPNEESNAAVNKIQIYFPTDHPILGVDPETAPGWHDTISTAHLTKAIQTDDGPITEYVNEVTWSGGSIPVRHFQEFYVLAQDLPTDTDQLVFKALQTYADGNIVRWIDPVTAGHPDPDHPTPILKLSNPTNSSGTSTAAASGTNQVAVNAKDLAKTSSVSSAKTIGVIGIILGGLGLLAATASILSSRRPRPN